MSSVFSRVKATLDGDTRLARVEGAPPPPLAALADKVAAVFGVPAAQLALTDEAGALLTSDGDVARALDAAAAAGKVARVVAHVTEPHPEPAPEQPSTTPAACEAVSVPPDAAADSEAKPAPVSPLPTYDECATSLLLSNVVDSRMPCSLGTACPCRDDFQHAAVFFHPPRESSNKARPEPVSAAPPAPRLSSVVDPRMPCRFGAACHKLDRPHHVARHFHTPEVLQAHAQACQAGSAAPRHHGGEGAMARVERQVNSIASMVSAVLAQMPASAGDGTNKPLPPRPAAAAATAPLERPVHVGVVCDVCRCDIVGVRYKCGHCVDFDLCEACEQRLVESDSLAVHDPTHIFVKIRRPVLVGPTEPWISSRPPLHDMPRQQGPAKKPAVPTAPAFVPAPPAKIEAAFVGDITVPDKTVFAPGARFVKTWAVRNTGTLPWPPGMRAVRLRADELTRVSVVSLSERVAPGAIAHISVEMVAPSQPGRYISKWKLLPHTGTELVIFWAEIIVVVCQPVEATAKVVPEVKAEAAVPEVKAEAAVPEAKAEAAVPEVEISPAAAPAPEPVPAPEPTPATASPAAASPAAASPSASPMPAEQSAGHEWSYVSVQEDDGFQEQLHQLMGMGFCNRQQNLQLLRQHSGNIGATIDALAEQNDLNWHKRR